MLDTVDERIEAGRGGKQVSSANPDAIAQPERDAGAHAHAHTVRDAYHHANTLAHGLTQPERDGDTDRTPARRHPNTYGHSHSDDHPQPDRDTDADHFTHAEPDRDADTGDLGGV